MFTFFFYLEFDSDFDSRDGSDNENENVNKYEVRKRIFFLFFNERMFVCIRQFKFHHRHLHLLVPRRLVRRIFVIEAIVVVMFA